MGVGMIVICDRADAGAVIQNAARAGIAGWTLGEIRPGSGRAILE
jgi:phosphoribosylaminoimidazole (AIR) synthetase